MICEGVTPVHTASLKRISWFLQLRNILRFPKYSLAPQHPPSRNRRFVIDGFGAARVSTPSKNLEPRISTRPKGSPVPEYLKRQVSPKPVARHDILGKQAVLPTAATGAYQAPKTQNIFWTATTTPRPPSLGQRHAGPKKNLEPDAQNALTDRVFKIQKLIRQLAPQGHRYISPVLPNHQTSDPAALQSRRARSFASHQRTDTLLRANPPKDTADRKQFADESTQPESNGSGDAFDDKSGTDKIPRTSTIHIDGSVLGRWAIQHLERVLGKPATGMTGVDPRASPPRSRVSPF
jgi:hypothetical protein